MDEPAVADTTIEYADPVGESVFRIPRDISMREWFRLACLEHYRGRLTDRQVEVLKYASLEADPKTGLITDVPRWIATYGAAVGVKKSLAYRYRAELVELGWLRKARGTSYGVTAVYELQLPARLLPQGHLPEDLLPTVMHDPEPDHADTTYGHLTSRPPCVTLTLVPPAGAEPEANPFDADLDGAEAPGYEPAPEALRGTEQDTVIPWADLLESPDFFGVEVCPYNARASYHLDLETDVSRGANHTNRTNGRRCASPELVTAAESAAATATLAACRGSWLGQRGPNGGLTTAEATALQPVVVLALRRTTANDLIDRLSSQVRSARSLPHVLGRRLWDLIRSRRAHSDERWPDTPVDDGTRYADMITEHAATQQAATFGRTRFLAAARADLDRLHANQRPDHAAAQPPGPVTPFARENETAFRAELGDEAAAVYDTDQAPARRPSAWQLAAARARRERRG